MRGRRALVELATCLACCFALSLGTGAPWWCWVSAGLVIGTVRVAGGVYSKQATGG